MTSSKSKCLTKAPTAVQKRVDIGGGQDGWTDT